MKLRLRGNSLRLRLTRTEVARVGDGGRVEETVEFGPDTHQRLVYALEVSDESERIAACLEDRRIVVTMPKRLAQLWAADTEQIGIEAEQPLSEEADGAKLRLLIEKDFACLTDSRGAEDADTFPHPMEGTLRC